MIIKNFIDKYQFFPARTIRTMWGPVRRVYMLISAINAKGHSSQNKCLAHLLQLSELVIFLTSFVSFFLRNKQNRILENFNQKTN